MTFWAVAGVDSALSKACSVRMAEPSTVVRPSDGIGGLLGSGAAGIFGRRCAAAEVRVPVAAGQVHPPGSLLGGNDMSHDPGRRIQVGNHVKKDLPPTGQGLLIDAQL